MTAAAAPLSRGFPEAFWPEHDKLLHAATKCAPTVQVYAVEAINATQVMLEGATPTGCDKKGRPTWKKATDKVRCFVTMDEYRAASDRQKAAIEARKKADAQQSLSGLEPQPASSAGAQP